MRAEKEEVPNLNRYVEATAVAKYIQLSTGVKAVVFDGTSPQYDILEPHIFSAQVQTTWLGPSIERHLANISNNTLIRVRDVFDLEAMICMVDGCCMVLGPYTETMWDDQIEEARLARLGLSSDAFLSYKRYRCCYPLIAAEEVSMCATHFAVAVFPAFDAFYTQTHFESAETVEVEIKNDAELDVREYHDVQKRYVIENEFMRCVSLGRFQAAKDCWRKLSPLAGMAYLQLPQNSKAVVGHAAVFRTLCRKAAEKSGIRLMELDAISQDYMQQVYQVDSVAQVHALNNQMLEAVCTAIHASRMRQYNKPMRRVFDFIDTFMGQALTLETIAKEAGISVTHLNRQFKEALGMTVGQYLAYCRSRKAAELLAYSDLTVQEISAYVGYLDNNYFVKVFKRQYHVTPTEYRKRIVG